MHGSLSVPASEAGDLDCGNGRFDGVYYIVPPSSNISRVDAYFSSVIDNFSGQMNEFTGISGNRSIVETYYDYEGLPLLKNGLELYHKINKELPYYREEREKIFFVDNNSNSYSNYEVKQYNKKINPVDKHPLLGRIKRKQRTDLFSKLEKISNDVPTNLAARLRVEHTTLSYLISLHNVKVGEISVSVFHIDNYGIPNTSLLLKIEPVSGGKKYLSKEESSILANYLCSVSKGFGDNLPGVEPVIQFGYAEYNKMADEMLPIRNLLQSHPILFQVGQILVLTIIGFLFIYLLIGRYRQQGKCRTTIHIQNN